MIDPHRVRVVFRLAYVRWLVFVREPGTLFWSFAFPVLLTIALGIAFRARGPEPSAVGVLDERVDVSHSDAGFDLGDPDALVRALSAAPDLEVTKVSEASATKGLRGGRLGVVVVPGWPVRFRLDRARIEGKLAEALAKAALDKALGAEERAPFASIPVTATGSRYVDFLVPGLLGMTLMSSSLWGIGYVLVDMRVKRLLKRFVATPLRRSELLASFLLVRAWVLVFEAPPLLLAAWAIFGIKVYGSFATLLFLVVLGAGSFACLALLIASRARSSQVVSGLINLIQLPMTIVSGVFFATDKFPARVQPFLRALPLTALNDGFRKVTIDGASFSGVLPEIGVLSAWGLASFALAIRLFLYE